MMKRKCLAAATTCNSAVWAMLLSLVLCLCSCQDPKQSHNDGGTYARLTASERKAADSALTVAAGINRDVKYYLRTHNVLDNGIPGVRPAAMYCATAVSQYTQSPIGAHPFC